jgi:hypothetical protein
MYTRLFVLHTYLRELFLELNEIAEQLRENTVDTACPLELPTVEDLVEVHEAILISLPGAFREFILQVSDVIYGSVEPVTIADPRSHTYLPEVASEAWAQGMPRELIPLCVCREGTYCVSEDDAVHLWQVGDNEPETKFDDVWQWAQAVWLES